MKKQNGITLIALVITIIVLLILAGVSIAMLTGENGILNKATTATTRTKEAEAEESVKLAVNVVLADKLDPDTDTNEITADAIIAANNNSNVTLEPGTGAATDKIAITAKIGKETYNFTVEKATGKVESVTTGGGATTE